MLTLSIVLAAVAIALAWPIPLALEKANWTRVHPARALAIWQVVALAGGLSMIGAPTAFGLIPFEGSIPAAIAALVPFFLAGPLPAPVGVLTIAALSSAVGLTIHLLLNLLYTLVRTERERRRHRALIELLSDPDPDHANTRIVDYPAPMAYCLPGVSTVTVLSQGLIAALSEQELKAVLAHEHAHLRQFHHLVLLAFKAWRSALPWFPIASRAEAQVSLLVELLADDQARRQVGDQTLAQAIAVVGSTWRFDSLSESSGGPVTTPASAPLSFDGKSALGIRLTRLTDSSPER